MSFPLLTAILALFALGALPHWPRSTTQGYLPSGLLGLLILVLLDLWLLQHP